MTSSCGRWESGKKEVAPGESGHGRMAPKVVHVLKTGTCEDVSFSGKRDFVDGVKTRILRWGDFSGLSTWA